MPLQEPIHLQSTWIKCENSFNNRFLDCKSKTRATLYWIRTGKCWFWTRANNTLSGACRAPLMQQQMRPPFLCLTQKSSQVSSLCGPLNLAQPQNCRSEEVCMLISQWTRTCVTTSNNLRQLHWRHTPTTSNRQNKLQNTTVTSFCLRYLMKLLHVKVLNWIQIHTD